MFQLFEFPLGACQGNGVVEMDTVLLNQFQSNEPHVGKIRTVQKLFVVLEPVLEPVKVFNQRSVLVDMDFGNRVLLGDLLDDIRDPIVVQTEFVMLEDFTYLVPQLSRLDVRFDHSDNMVRNFATISQQLVQDIEEPRFLTVPMDGTTVVGRFHLVVGRQVHGVAVFHNPVHFKPPVLGEPIIVDLV